jgi:hypothetical protein
LLVSKCQIVRPQHVRRAAAEGVAAVLRMLRYCGCGITPKTFDFVSYIAYPNVLGVQAMVMVFILLLLLLTSVGTAVTPLPFAIHSTVFSNRLDKVEASVATLTASTAASTAILTRLEAKFDTMELKMDTKFDTMELKMDTKLEHTCYDSDHQNKIGFVVQCLLEFVQFCVHFKLHRIKFFCPF